jgi:ADP-ribosylation factor-like protein 1
MSHYAGIETAEDFAFVTSLQPTVPVRKHHDFVEVTLLGPTGAGKTSILSLLKTGMLGAITSTDKVHSVVLAWLPHVAFNVTEVRGSHTELWAAECLPTVNSPAPFAIVYVVDSTDPDRLPLAGRQLEQLLGCPQLRDTLFVVVANKHGFHESGALDSETIERALNIRTNRTQVVVYVTASCTNKTGLADVLAAIHVALPDPTSK